MRKTRISNIHATCVRLGRAARAFGAPAKAGVLILGKSGAGKSRLALELIAMGAELVADDRVELFVRAGGLMGRAPANIAGFLEVRGVGIVEMAHARDAAIALVVKLTDAVSQRLPGPRVYEPPKSLLLSPDKWPSMLLLDGSDKAAAAKIAVAVAAFTQGRFRDSAKGH